MNTCKRSVSFVENLQFEISDNLNNEALVLADVDNDGDNELVVGQINGELLIFKGSSVKPYKSCRNLGMITCLGVGDFWNQRENYLFCVTVEGWCHIFFITPETTQETFKPISSLLLPSNCKIILLADVDGDGMLELVTGHADRAVYIHKLHVVKEHQKQSDVCDQPSTEKEDKKKKVKPSVSTNRHDLDKINENSIETAQKLNGKDLKQEGTIAKLYHVGNKVSGDAVQKRIVSFKVEEVHHWTIPRQIGSLVVFDMETTRYLLASYPGGSYIILNSWNLSEQQKDGDQMSSSASKSTFRQFPHVWGRSKDIPLNLLTLKCCDPDAPASCLEKHLVLCTQDGQVTLLYGSKLQWSLCIEQGFYNLFALSKLDITGDGNEEIALCSWEGNTYIIDRLKNVVQFSFGENVMGFCAGSYAFSPGKNLPALVYVTSSNRVIIYWNAWQSLMVPTYLNPLTPEI